MDQEAFKKTIRDHFSSLPADDAKTLLQKGQEQFDEMQRLLRGLVDAGETMLPESALRQCQQMGSEILDMLSEDGFTGHQVLHLMARLLHTILASYNPQDMMAELEAEKAASEVH